MKKDKNRPICRVVLLTGVSAVVVQILTVRECIAQFAGNEFVIALILFNRLIPGGIGNRMAHIIHFRFFPATANRLEWLSVFPAVLPDRDPRGPGRKDGHGRSAGMTKKRGGQP